MRTPRLPVDCTDVAADLNGLVCFVKRRNVVSAHVPSHFKRSLQSSCHHTATDAACHIGRKHIHQNLEPASHHAARHTTE